MADDVEYVKVTSEKLNFALDNPHVLGIIVAIIAVIITLFIFSLYRRSKSRRNGVLLLGLCDSGKTLIFARLLSGKYVQTHTSIKENVGDYLAGSVLLKIIDIPGHERLRGRYFDQFKNIARGLVFIVDSLEIQKDVKDVAEFLYNCLSDSTVRSYSPPILILCNKQDEPTAKGSAVIKTLLEKEMNILRKTKTSQLQSIENTSSNVFLGKEGKDFEFAHLAPMKIDFAESSALFQEEDNAISLEALEEWIISIA